MERHMHTGFHPMVRISILVVIISGQLGLIEARSPIEGQQALPGVVILSTGGTIASQYSEEHAGLVPALTGEQMVRAVPELADIARVEVVQVANIGSPDMTPAIWRRVLQAARDALARDDVHGVVVTHGTDTLEETAYFLDLTTGGDEPVVLVGAQRAPSYPDTDGPRNLLNAVRVAVHPEARGMGALVVMNGQVHAAREVTKTSTIARETFRTLEFGALGVADLGGVRMYRAPLRRQEFLIEPESASRPSRGGRPLCRNRREAASKPGRRSRPRLTGRGGDRGDRVGARQ